MPTFFTDLFQAHKKVEAATKANKVEVLNDYSRLDLDKRVQELEKIFSGHNLWWCIFSVLKKELVFFVCLGVLLAVFTAFFPIGLQFLFDSLGKQQQKSDFLWPILVSVLIIARTSLNWYQNWQEKKLSLVIQHLMMRLLFRRLQKIDLDALKNEGKDPLNYINNYCAQLTQIIYLFDFLITSLFILCLAIIIFIQFGWPAIFLIITIGLLTFALQKMIIVIGEIYYSYINSEHSRVNIIQQIINNFRSIKRQYLESHIFSSLSKIRYQQTKILRQRSIWQTINRTLEDHFGFLVIFTFLIAISWGDLDLTAAKILSLLALVRFLLDGIQNNLANFRVLRNTINPSKEIEQLFRNYQVLYSEDPAKSSNNLNTGEIVINYLEQNRFYLVRKGSRLAIIGQNGSGKSALLAQLAGKKINNAFITVQSKGFSILIDRQQTVFAANVLENITLWDKSPDLARYEKALLKSGLLNDLNIREQGDLKEVNENNFSEGQKQRLFLARALYFDSDILLLDDIFASMDTETANIIAERLLNDDLEQSTRVFSTSRFELLHYADEILILGKNDFIILRPNEVFNSSNLTICQEILGLELTNYLINALKNLKNRSVSAMQPAINQIDKTDLSENESVDPENIIHKSFNIRDLYQNISSIFPKWSLPILLIVAVCLPLGSTLFTVIIEQYTQSKNGKILLELSLVIGLIILISGWRYFLSFRLPIFYINNLHNFFIFHLLKGKNPSQYLGRFTQDFFDLEMEIPNSLVSIFINIFEACFYILLLSVNNPVALILLIPILILLVRNYQQSKRIIIAVANLQTKLREPLFAFIQPSLSHLSHRSSLVFRKMIEKRFIDLSDSQISGSYWVNMAINQINLSIQTAVAIFFTVILWLSILNSQQNIISISPVLAIFLALNLSNQLTIIFDRLRSTDLIMTKFDRLAELIDQKYLPTAQKIKSIDLSSSEKTRQNPLCQQEQTIKSESLVMISNLSYVIDNNYILRNISLNINQGTCIAFVGPSGSGKSTFAQLLAGSLEIQAGNILINGLIPNNDSQAMRKVLFYIESDFWVGNLKLKDFLDPMNCFQHSNLEAMLSKFYLDKPNLDQNISQLSLGQRQLANLIRVLLQNPKILVLDEALSGLSVAHERSVIEQLKTDFPQITHLCILHRMDNLDLFDKLISLANGEIEVINNR